MQAAGPDSWPGGSGDTMNALAAQDVEAADLLALARLDHDGAPGGCGPPWSQAGRPVPEMIAAAPGRPRQLLTPALTGAVYRRGPPPHARPCRPHSQRPPGDSPR